MKKPMLRVFDASGRVVFRQAPKPLVNERLSVPGLPAGGVYFGLISEAGKRKMVRVNIMR